MVADLGTRPSNIVQQAVVAFIAHGTAMPSQVLEPWAQSVVSITLDSCLDTMQMTDEQAQRAAQVDGIASRITLPLYRGVHFIAANGEPYVQSNMYA